MPAELDLESSIQALNETIAKDLKSVEVIPGDWTDWTSSPSEVPPSASFPFLLQEGNFGLPQTVLLRLYCASVAFRRVKSAMLPGDATIDKILSQTTCLLVVNPAHQTALNARKRLISLGKHSPEKELRLLELLQRGIKICAKESALWAHRQWCLLFINGSIDNHFKAQVESGSYIRRIPSLTEDMQSLPFFSPKSAGNEFSIVWKACTLYPRNYHAWTHCQYALNACCAMLAHESLAKQTRNDLSIVILDVFRRLRVWTEDHASDFSSIHHLLTIRPVIRRLIFAGLIDAEYSDRLQKESTVSSLAESAKGLLLYFGEPRKSGWLYLQYLLPHLSSQERETYAKLMMEVDMPQWEVHRKHLVELLQNTPGDDG